MGTASYGGWHAARFLHWISGRWSKRVKPSMEKNSTYNAYNNLHTHVHIYIHIYTFIFYVYIYKYIIIYTYNYIYIYNYIHLQYHTCDQRFWVRLTATSNQILSDSACGKTKHPALDPGTGMVIENEGMHDHCCVHICHNSITINP